MMWATSESFLEAPEFVLTRQSAEEKHIQYKH